MDWWQTPGGVVRRSVGAEHSTAHESAAAGMVAPWDETDLEQRSVERRHFDDAWASSGIGLQRALVRRGWTGVWVDVPDTRPQVLKDMDRAALAAQSVVEATGPGEVSSAQVTARERFAPLRTVT